MCVCVCVFVCMCMYVCVLSVENLYFENEIEKLTKDTIGPGPWMPEHRLQHVHLTGVLVSVFRFLFVFCLIRCHVHKNSSHLTYSHAPRSLVALYTVVFFENNLTIHAIFFLVQFSIGFTCKTWRTSTLTNNVMNFSKAVRLLLLSSSALLLSHPAPP